MRVPSRRPRRSSARGSLALLSPPLALGACATAPPAAPPPARGRGGASPPRRRWQSFNDLRTLRRDLDPAGRSLAAPLRRPAPRAPRRSASRPCRPSARRCSSWRATPSRSPSGRSLRNRAYLLPATPDANRRWLGLALAAEDLVALLAGHVRPIPAPRTGALVAADERGPSLRLTGAEGTQRIWLDPAGRPLAGRVDRGQESPARDLRRAGDELPPRVAPAVISLATLDGRLEVVRAVSRARDRLWIRSRSAVAECAARRGNPRLPLTLRRTAC